MRFVNIINDFNQLNYWF